MSTPAPVAVAPPVDLGVPPKAPAAAAAAIDEAPIAELYHSRRSSTQRSWLWVALPVGGLLVVPMIGLFYAATSSFGKAEPDAPGSAALEDGDEPTDPATPGVKSKRAKRSTTGSRSPTMGQKPRSDGAAACCAKLHELGRTAPLDVRPAYLSSASSCDRAPDADRAFSRVKGNLKATKAELPEECEN